MFNSFSPSSSILCNIFISWDVSDWERLRTSFRGLQYRILLFRCEGINSLFKKYECLFMFSIKLPSLLSLMPPKWGTVWIDMNRKTYECFKCSTVGCFLMNSWKIFPKDTAVWVTKLLIRYLFLLQKYLSSDFSCATANLHQWDGDHKLGQLSQKHRSWKVSKCGIKNLVFQEYKILNSILPKLKVCFKMVQ